MDVAAGEGQEYVVVAAVATALDKVAELKRQIGPDKARLITLTEQMEKVMWVLCLVDYCDVDVRYEITKILLR